MLSTVALRIPRRNCLSAGRLYLSSGIRATTGSTLALSKGYATATAAAPSAPSPTTTSVASSSDIRAAIASKTANDGIPTISPRTPSSDDDRKMEDWVLYHPVYRDEDHQAVKVLRFENKTFGDRLATGLVKLFRTGFDVVTRYKHHSPEQALKAAAKAGKTNLSLKEMRDMGLVMDDKQWLNRILFLESIAGVPGMVGAVLRHLRSLRLLRRDGGYVKLLLEEAENERLHLLTFMKVGHPSLFFRAMVLGAQGIFFNSFFLAYLISPKICHRFVGKLEEEAVITYSLAIKEVEAGRLPEWENKPAPRIAIDYWRLKEDAKMLDVLYAVRSDEAGHRFANHSLANLEDKDFNPFAIKKPAGAVQGSVVGFTREEGLKWYEDASKALKLAKKER